MSVTVCTYTAYILLFYTRIQIFALCVKVWYDFNKKSDVVKYFWIFDKNHILFRSRD